MRAIAILMVEVSRKERNDELAMNLTGKIMQAVTDAMKEAKEAQGTEAGLQLAKEVAVEARETMMELRKITLRIKTEQGKILANLMSAPTSFEQRPTYAAAAMKEGAQETQAWHTTSRPTIIMARAVCEDAKARQILIDDNPSRAENSSTRLSHLTEKELVEKARLALKAIEDKFEDKVVIHLARKLPRGDIIYELNSIDAACKLKS